MKFFNKLKYNLFSYPIVAVFILLLSTFLVDLLNDGIVHTSNGFCVFLYHIFDNKIAMGWSSGIGSFFAALVALYVAIYSNKKYPPFLKYEGYYDAQRNGIVIQILNLSKTADFVRLTDIYFSSTCPKLLGRDHVLAPDNLLHYGWFNRIDGISVLTINIDHKDMALRGNKNLITEFLKSKRKDLVFIFQDYYRKRQYPVMFSRKYILYANKEYKKDMKVTPIRHQLDN